MCATTIVGISSLTIGLGGTIGGLLMEWSAGSTYQHINSFSVPDADAQYRRERNEAILVRDIGIVMGIAGLGMTIAGATYDRSKQHRRWSLIAPKKNEIGVAYHF
jgi:hypothetical protein